MQTIRRNAKATALSLLLVFLAAAWALAQQIQVKNGNNWLECQGDASGHMQIVGGVAAGSSAASVNPVLAGALDGSANLQANKAPVNITLLALAARTAQVNSAAQVNPPPGYRGVRFHVNVTAASPPPRPTPPAVPAAQTPAPTTAAPVSPRTPAPPAPVRRLIPNLFQS